MGKVLRPEDFLKRKKVPKHIEEGLKDLNPELRKKAEEIIEANLEDFEELKPEAVLKRLREKYSFKIP